MCDVPRKRQHAKFKDSLHDAFFFRDTERVVIALKRKECSELVPKEKEWNRYETIGKEGRDQMVKECTMRRSARGHRSLNRPRETNGRPSVVAVVKTDVDKRMFRRFCRYTSPQGRGLGVIEWYLELTLLYCSG